MTKQDYYAECLSESLAEHGVAATPEQVSAITKDVAGAYENIGQAFYEPSMYSQVEHEKRETARGHKQDLAEACRHAELWKAEACRVARVDPYRAYIANGEVMLSRS